VYNLTAIIFDDASILFFKDLRLFLWILIILIKVWFRRIVQQILTSCSYYLLISKWAPIDWLIFWECWSLHPTIFDIVFFI